MKGFRAGGFFAPMPDDWNPSPTERKRCEAQLEGLIAAAFGETGGATVSDDPWKDMPIPKHPSQKERIQNAILHLGRIVGAASALREECFGEEVPEPLLQIEAAAKRAATWLGVTIWRDEHPEKES